jgi:hypothetical protein
MSGGQFDLGNVGGSLVSFMGGSGSILAFFTGGVFSDITVIITLPNKVYMKNEVQIKSQGRFVCCCCFLFVVTYILW